MKRSEAPPAGWYPDPEGGGRLRWWEGEDWSDHYRMPPRRYGPQDAAGGLPVPPPTVPPARTPTGAIGTLDRAQAEEMVQQFRQVARAEVERAADIFSARARQATSQIEPLISQYTGRAVRWLKIIGIVAFVAVVGWFVFQLVAQATFFDWLGDRIDNLGDG